MQQRTSVTEGIYEDCKYLKTKFSNLFEDFDSSDKAKSQLITNISRGVPNPGEKAEDKPNSWRYSKYINLKLARIIESLSDADRNKLVQAWYYYAASQSDLSAVYAKVE